MFSVPQEKRSNPEKVLTRRRKRNLALGRIDDPFPVVSGGVLGAPRDRSSEPDHKKYLPLRVERPKTERGFQEEHILQGEGMTSPRSSGIQGAPSSTDSRSTMPENALFSDLFKLAQEPHPFLEVFR